MEKTVADIPDDELLRRVVRHVVRRRLNGAPAWYAVNRAFSLGSTFSEQLCRRFGINPESGNDITT
jgi:hypothetical protein